MARSPKIGQVLQLITSEYPDRLPYPGTGRELAQTILWNHPDLTDGDRLFANVALFSAQHHVYYAVQLDLHGKPIQSFVTGIDVPNQIISIPVKMNDGSFSVFNVPPDLALHYAIITIQPPNR